MTQSLTIIRMKKEAEAINDNAHKEKKKWQPFMIMATKKEGIFDDNGNKEKKKLQPLTMMATRKRRSHGL